MYIFSFYISATVKQVLTSKDLELGDLDYEEHTD